MELEDRVREANGDFVGPKEQQIGKRLWPSVSDNLSSRIL